MKYTRIFAMFGLLIVVALLTLPFGSIQPVSAQAPSQGSRTPGAINPAYQPTPPPIGGGGVVPSPNGMFSNLSFSTASDGPAIVNFPAGTQAVFARFDFANIQPGGTLTRQWYLNGQPYITRSEAWNPAWGTNGRLTHISIYDYNGMLPSGSYSVTIFLTGTNVYISGSFAVASGVVYPTSTPNPVPTNAYFYNLTTSTSSAGAAMSYFPAGTRAVYIRFNYANIPIGTILRREWYKDGQLFRSAQDIWSSYWGSNGRLTHISLYDYTYGLASGNYRVVVSLPYFPSVRAEAAFTIQSGVPTGNYFSNLTFSTSVNGPAYSYFYAYTREIFARWSYVNAPYGSILVRRWYRNGVLWLTRREGWYRTGSGTVYASVYDYQYGLLPGNYYVEISLENVPNSTITGSFRVG